MASSEKRFYDIHMHVFNLSHAGLMAFINRFFLNNALNFNDLLDGKYFKILRYYFFKKGHSEAESIAIMRKRLIKVSFRIIIILALAFLWFCCIRQHLSFNFSGIWNNILSWFIYVTGFLFSVILAYLLIFLIKKYFKKLFCKKEKSKKIPHTINVLSIFENDLAHQLRYLEMDYLSMHQDIRDYIFTAGNPDPREFYDELKKMWEAHDSKLEINGQEINTVILTPLMMNFNSKGFEKLDKNKVHYNLPPAKLIIEQLIDLFNGIQSYYKTSLKVLEIYPFMGVNPGVYRHGVSVETDMKIKIPEKLEGKVVFLPIIKMLVFVMEMTDEEQVFFLDSIKDDNLRKKVREKMNTFHLSDFEDGYPKDNTFPKMLDKYFGKYRGKAKDFRKAYKKTFGAKKNKTWRDIRSNFFSGIKIYPPLGFDPYPNEKPTEEELSKAKTQKEKDRMKADYFNTWVNTHFLYQYCIKKNIPMTTHCSDGGFVIMEEKWSRMRAKPDCWASVLEDYPELKLNFGHFGIQLNSKKHGWGEWNKTIIDLILNDKYPNVYADISDLGESKKKYKKLGEAIHAAIREKATDEVGRKDLWQKLCENLLFGTDFMVNLFHTDSYLSYIETWEDTDVFSNSEKVNLASANPHRFLFEGRKQ